MKSKGAAEVVLLLIFAAFCSKQAVEPDGPAQLTFSGASADLKATEIVPTLDGTISKRENVIWCGSFECAWKGLQDPGSKH